MNEFNMIYNSKQSSKSLEMVELIGVQSIPIESEYKF